MNWLSTFRTLVEVGHFTKTAEKLFMTQPGVSQHIKKLESQLGTALLRKNGKQFELTDAGQSVYQYAVSQQEEEEKLKEKIRVDSPYSGECLFAMSGSLCMQFQPAFLQRQVEHPGLVVSLEAAPNSRIVEGVLNNKIDLGVVTQRIPSQYLDYHRIGEERLCVVTPGDFNTGEWTLDDLVSLGVIDHPDCVHYIARFLDVYQLGGEQQRFPRSGYINQLSQILLPVAAGLGFTILPNSAVQAFPEQDKIAVLPLKTEIKEPLYLVSKKHRPLPVRYEWFTENIRSSFCGTQSS